MQCQSSRHCPKWHNCHTTGSVKILLLSSTTCITATCTMHAPNIHCTGNTSNTDETGSSCSFHSSCSEECPGTKVCNILCHTCAATKIWPCLHGTKMPDPGDLRTLNLDCPQTLFLSCTTAYNPADHCIKSLCILFSERGMSYDRI